MGIKEILMARDGISATEAQAEFDAVQDDFWEALDTGDLESAWYVMESLGLEPDYLEELV
jgi:hypothetical protein